MAGSAPLRLVLVGKTGVGKSAAGNTILGERLFKSESRATSVTSTCTSNTRNVDGQDVTVIDTPGLYDTNMPNEYIVQETVRGVRMVAPGPHAFLLVIDLRRFTEEEKNTVKNFQSVFGSDVHKNMIVVFTRRDDLEYDNKSVQQFVQEAGSELQQLIYSCGNRYLAFNNRKIEDRTQVQELLKMIHKMLSENNHSYYSYELFEKDKKIAELEAKVRDLQRQNYSSCSIL